MRLAKRYCLLGSCKAKVLKDFWQNYMTSRVHLQVKSIAS